MALRQEHEGIVGTQASRHRPDGVDCRLPMHGPLADEDIGYSVEKGVQDRLPLEFVQHDHARPQVVVQQQRSQQDHQIGHPAMATEDQDRVCLDEHGATRRSSSAC